MLKPPSPYDLNHAPQEARSSGYCRHCNQLEQVQQPIDFPFFIEVFEGEVKVTREADYDPRELAAFIVRACNSYKGK